MQVRKLRDIEDLEPTQGSIVNEGAGGSGVIFVKSRTKGQAGRTFPSGSGSNGGSAKPAARSVLPPVGDREQLALEAVRRALRLNPEQIRDVRSRRGIGVDAIDELRQCYEIKMSSGSAYPTDITLLASEVEAAQNDPDFFLAVVAGLEEGDGCLKVRFIFNPLEQLAAKIRGKGCDIYFTVEGCTYNIEVKSSEEDGAGFTLGTSEIRRAREIARRRRRRQREEFFVLKVDHVLMPEPSFTLLPNPYDPAYQDRFVIIDEGARVSYKT